MSAEDPAGRRLRALTLGASKRGSDVVESLRIQVACSYLCYLRIAFLMNHIGEFQPPNFHYVAQKCFAGLLLLTLFVSGGEGARGRREAMPLVVCFRCMRVCTLRAHSSVITTADSGDWAWLSMRWKDCRKIRRPADDVPWPRFLSTPFFGDEGDSS